MIEGLGELGEVEIEKLQQVMQKLKELDMLSKSHKKGEELVEIEDRKVCKISNKLIEAKYKLTLEEQRLILLTIAQVDKDDEDFKTYRIDLKNLEDKVNKKINKTRMKDLAFAIMKKPFMLPETKKIYNFFSAIEPLEAESALKVQFHPDLKPFLLNLKKEFTKYSLENLLNLQSVYAVRIYQLLKQYEQIGSRKFNVDELREILQTPSSYKNFKDFKIKVLNIAKKEINAKTDIKIDWEVTKRAGRKIVEIEFTIKKQTQKPKEPSTKQTKIKVINNNIALKNINKLQQNLAKITNFKLFRTKVLQDYNTKILVLDDDIFSIKGVYLAKNDVVLKADEALKQWDLLFKNKNEIKIFDNEEEYKINTIKQKTFYRKENGREELEEFKAEEVKKIDGKMFNVKLKSVTGDFYFTVKKPLVNFIKYDKFELDMVQKSFIFLL